MKRLLIIALIAASNIQAQEKDLFDNSQFEKGTEILDNKSDLRKREYELGLRSQIAEEELRIINLQKEIKKNKFILENVPPEYIGNEKAYYQKMSKQKSFEELLPELNSGTKSDYLVETFTIDQVKMIPLLKEKQAPVVVPKIEVIKEAPKPKRKAIVALPDPVEPIQVDSDLSQLKDMLSPSEFEKVKRMYNSQLVNAPKQNTTIKTKPLPDYELDIDINAIYIFGENRGADIQLNVMYRNGTTEKKEVKEIKVGQFIKIDKDIILVKHIDFKLIEFENTKTGETYIASKNIR